MAVERAVSVYKRTSFDKEKNKRFARWILAILPFVIMSSLVHELLYCQIFKHDTNNKIENNAVILPTDIIEIDSYF